MAAHSHSNFFQDLESILDPNLHVSQGMAPAVFDGTEADRLVKLNGLLMALETAIDQHIDEPERLAPLLEMHDQLQAVITYLQHHPEQNPSLPVPMASTSNPSPPSLSTEPDADELDEWVVIESEADLQKKKQASVLPLPTLLERFPTLPHGDCTICWESDRPCFQLGCRHAFCLECLALFMYNHVEAAELDSLKCPACATPLRADEIEQFLTPALVEKYQRFSLEAFVKSEPNARWCPYAGCEGVFLVTPTEQNKGQKSSCPKCERPVCGNCGLRDHLDLKLSCAAFKSSQQPDPKTNKMLRRMGAQACPSCGMMLVRTTGCRTMHCPGCNGKFEWKGDEDETWLEKTAFLYPRLVKYLATSEEAHADGVATQVFAGGFAALIGLPILPLTLILGIPALMIYGGRNAKKGISNLIDDFKEKLEDDHQ